MQHYRCLIVEDEPLAAEVLKDYILQIPSLTLKGICNDAVYALEILEREKIDLIFLDIHLPKVKGLDFVKSLIHPPKIIITTAYSEYALKGYEHNVVDYLLKPVEFSRFLMAVNKLRHGLEQHEPGESSKIFEERKSLFFNVNKKKIKIYLDEILYIESLKEYIRIVTCENAIVTKFQLGQIEELLAKNNIIRIHRSYLVAKDKIQAYTATEVEINGKEIPIGRSFKEMVHSLIES